MVSANSELWEQIQAFDLDGDVTEPFSVRLARENDWSVSRAQKVIVEYKRFCFLAVVAGHPVSPSDAVDQAWHLHLIYTRNYWDDWCGKVLRTPLHHGPSHGGTRELVKYADWYEQTLASYERIFEAKPPRDLWPLMADKAKQEGRHLRVDVTSHLIIPVPRWLAAALRKWGRLF